MSEWSESSLDDFGAFALQSPRRFHSRGTGLPDADFALLRLTFPSVALS